LISANSPANAKILVVSPHPDDDVLMSAGVIHKAAQRGEPVRVVYMTNGDVGGEASGYGREREAVRALGRLGVSQDDAIFLGYPDGNPVLIYDDYTRCRCLTSPYTGASRPTETVGWDTWIITRTGSALPQPTTGRRGISSRTSRHHRVVSARSHLRDPEFDQQ
jgi:LmbE family N-acetylglucosaminyl deacetylase